MTMLTANHAAPLERRDKAPIPLDDHWRGVGEPRRWGDMTRESTSRLWALYCLCCVGLTIAGCSHHAVGPTGVPQRSAEFWRAVEQVANADMVIDYESELQFRVRTSSKDGVQVAGSLSDLKQTIAGLQVSSTNLAVVLMCPPMRILPEQEFNAKTIEIEGVLRQLGYRRVVIHLASAFGRPIYRE